jgi:hypothetical protein
MFRTDPAVKVPDDPNEATWSYEPGQELRDPTGHPSTQIRLSRAVDLS